MIPQYEDYVNLIRKYAWKAYRKNPNIDISDLISMGNIAYCEAIKTWDKNLGSFSTHLTWQLKDYLRPKRLRNCGLRVNREDHVALDDPEAPELADLSGPAVDREAGFRLAILSLSREAQEVVWLVLNLPEELADWTIRWVRPCLGSVRSYLRNTPTGEHPNGWPKAKIERAFNEIKTALMAL